VPVSIPPNAGKVLILGSNGFLGRYLTQRLNADGYDTIGVIGRAHVDLRDPAALPAFLERTPDAWALPSPILPEAGTNPRLNISFCFFLACEVGGSKFIDSAAASTQLAILRHNVQIYESVFPWLERTRTPFIFISSVLQFEPSPYGSIKRLGETWVRNMPPAGPAAAAAAQASSAAAAATPAEKPSPLGKSVRLWNIYGRERVSAKSHVLVDWAYQCIGGRAVAQSAAPPATGAAADAPSPAAAAQARVVRALTDGAEQRQFLHAQDAAAALVLLMRHWEAADEVTDITSGVTVTVGSTAPDVARAVAATAPAVASTAASDACSFVFSHRPAVARVSPPPTTGGSALVARLGWRPKVDFVDGLTDLVAALRAAVARARPLAPAAGVGRGGDGEDDGGIDLPLDAGDWVPARLPAAQALAALGAAEAGVVDSAAARPSAADTAAVKEEL
jgi:nucleoside-diphosphate-sugar epimerase